MSYGSEGFLFPRRDCGLAGRHYAWGSTLLERLTAFTSQIAEV